MIEAWLARIGHVLIALGVSASALADRTSIPPEVAYACFKTAYPDFMVKSSFLKTDSNTSIRLGDDDTFLLSEIGSKSIGELFSTPSLIDTLRWPYPNQAPDTAPPVGHDPGRIRHEGWLKKLYGTSPKAVGRALVSVNWLPGIVDRIIQFHGGHGAASALQRVSDELALLPTRFHKYLRKTAGTFNWRYIKGTSRLSAHAFGIAIDIDVTHSDYWRWAKDRRGGFKYRNRIPIEIVHIFEKHGFVWGGRWYHFDTMHFEYRPELFVQDCLPTR